VTGLAFLSEFWNSHRFQINGSLTGTVKDFTGNPFKEEWM